MCLFPRLIINKKYTKTKKNRGVIPPVLDERTKLVPVGCGDCIECRKQKARGWQVRLLEDIKKHRNGLFVTLTFSNENYTRIAEYIMDELEQEGHKERPEGYSLDNAIATKALRLFNENWRRKYGTALRHWMVTELGHKGTENIHMHGIVWTNEGAEAVRTMWERMYGFIWIGKYVNAATINYSIKYFTKKDLLHKTYKSIILTSPGIGKAYMDRKDWKQNKYNGTETVETYRTDTGHKIAMPIYWRNKIYTEQEREQLWIQRLDKGERWVCGERINVKQSEEIYYKILEYHQERNKILGYGDGTKDWGRQAYERERRLIVQKRRMNKEKKEAKANAPAHAQRAKRSPMDTHTGPITWANVSTDSPAP